MTARDTSLMRNLLLAALTILACVAPVRGEEPVRWIVGSEHLRVLYWPEHDELARLARETGEEAFGRLRRLLNAEPTGRIDVYIVRSRAEFDELAGAKHSTWVVGLALLGRGTILLKPVGPQRLPKLLAHELTHIMLDASMGPAGTSIPRWLHEGIAQYAADQWDRAQARTVARAALGNELLTLDELDAAFAAKQDQVDLAYAQSYTLVAYLASLRPGLGLAPLLDEIKKGRDVRTALGRAYRTPVPQIEKEWLEQTRTGYLSAALPPSSEMIVGALFLLAFGLAVVLVRRRSARIRQRMQEEERMRSLMANVRLIGDDAEPPHGGPDRADE